ncbi:MAG: hypothetical protein GAK31_02741 [Stenotrophomonas maltophilia]|uniref:Uncharacterized protein n=1 Tax=Stenotrophomonas maltophilia TaxID=40324 RepID=A0A7V8FGS3_STEMA|nr:MAG: hypothetical protein GAK31_02741 [Stenotrophomonas maltophilia]
MQVSNSHWMALARAIVMDDQRARQIRLLGLDEPWVVERFEGEETVCGQTRLQIDCLATDAFLELDP